MTKNAKNWITSSKELTDGADALVLKGFETEVSVSDDRRVRFVVSTGDVDRDNDVVSAKGWDLASYKRNPVILWAHSQDDLPVAKCVSISVEGDKLIAEAEFAKHEFAETVYQLVKDGFLRATSVGFRALDWTRNEKRNGCDFNKQELLEFSIVPVPANQNALIAASAAGVDLSVIKGWMDSVVAAWPEPMEIVKASSAVVEKTTADEPVQKSGRRLSAKTLDCIQKAHGHADMCMKALHSVMDENPEPGDTEEVEPEPKKTVKAAAESEDMFLELSDEPELAEGQIDVSMDDLRDIMRSVMADGMKGVAREAAERASNQLRGRVD